jgi:hypothetical protein
MQTILRKSCKRERKYPSSGTKARKRIETIFLRLTDQLIIIRNYAKETEELFTRIIGEISVQTFLQYIDHVNGKPIGRIKYALN